MWCLYYEWQMREVNKAMALPKGFKKVECFLIKHWIKLKWVFSSAYNFYLTFSNWMEDPKTILLLLLLIESEKNNSTS